MKFILSTGVVSVHSAVSAGWTESVFGRNQTCCKTRENPRRLYNLDRLWIPSINPLNCPPPNNPFSSCFLIIFITKFLFFFLCVPSLIKYVLGSRERRQDIIIISLLNPTEREKKSSAVCFFEPMLGNQPNHLSLAWPWFWSEANLNICTLDFDELKVVNSLVNKQWWAVPKQYVGRLCG